MLETKQSYKAKEMCNLFGFLHAFRDKCSLVSCSKDIALFELRKKLLNTTTEHACTCSMPTPTLA